MRPRCLSRLIGLLLAAVVPAVPALATTVHDGFREQTVFSGLSSPTAVRFAPDGRVFIAEQSGLIKVFDGLGDTTAQIVADLRTSVHHYWDRGMLGLAIDPLFPAQPYIYVSYTYNFDPHDANSAFPRWPDYCPTPPGGTSDGCTVNGRVSRLQVAPDNTLVGDETVLMENRWCQQFPSHSMGDLVFSDQSRVLYVGAGEGASFGFADYGQEGSPRNPCDDPPVGQGGNQTAPGAEGGSLRAQDLRTPGDPVGLGGTVIAIDPDTGGPASTNPLLGGDSGDDPIIAYGLRNPYRMTHRGGTDEIWIGDVGKSGWDEINRIVDAGDPDVENFGWPCYEGPFVYDAFDEANLTLCEQLYAEGDDAVNDPYYAYRHDFHLDPDPQPFRCSETNGAAISGLAFYTGSRYPASYAGALFFTDYSRDCIFAMEIGSDGDPEPATRTTFADAVSNPVDLQLGPGDVLYYADVDGGRIYRINYCSADDATCDGWNDDCDHQTDENYLPAAVSCGIGECESTGTTSCVSGGVVDDCVPGSPAADDDCNGLDDDCDGEADEHAAAPAASALLLVDRDGLSWSAMPGAETYELIRGDLDPLKDAGDFATAVTECMEQQWDATTYAYTAKPASGEAEWFLVAGTNCAGRGSYDSGSAGQTAPRSGIDLDPDACGQEP